MVENSQNGVSRSLSCSIHEDISILVAILMSLIFAIITIYRHTYTIRFYLWYRCQLTITLLHQWTNVYFTNRRRVPMSYHLFWLAAVTTVKSTVRENYVIIQIISLMSTMSTFAVWIKLQQRALSRTLCFVLRLSCRIDPERWTMARWPLRQYWFQPKHYIAGRTRYRIVHSGQLSCLASIHVADAARFWRGQSHQWPVGSPVNKPSPRVTKC